MNTSLSDRMKSLHGMSDAEYEDMQQKEAAMARAKVFPDFDTKLAEAPKPKISRWQRFVQWCKG